MSSYKSKHTGATIDAAIDRAKDGGAIDTALSKKAPTGYGLGGTYGAYIDDFNTKVVIGWYQAFKDSLNAPMEPGSGSKLAYGVLRVERRESFIYQSYNVDRHENSVSLRRISIDAGKTWGEWEYENPRMKIGVEYRTTEIFDDKPVYVKLVNFGALPNATSKYVDPNISNFEKLIEPMTVTFYTSDGSVHGSSILSDTGIVARSWFKMASGGIAIRTMENRTSDSAIVKLKYTKTTD